MRIGEHHYSFAVTDKAATELYSLAYYSAEEINAELLGEIFSRHSELHNSFDDVQISYDYPGSVLVPRVLNYPDEGRQLLNIIHGYTVGSSIVSDQLGQWQLANVYAVPTDVREWAARVFPSHRHRHSYSVAIGMMSPDPSDHILVELNKDEFSFIVVKERKVQIAQTLLYASPEDILYYLLKTCNQFSLSREEVQLFISGLIEKESQLYRELYLNFLKIHFREPTWRVATNGEPEFPAHFFTSLNDVARCAS
jgi:hypothetical protein